MQNLVTKGREYFHKVGVKFVKAFLPDAKKPFYLRTAIPQELDIEGVAAMAERYNILTKREVIVEGFNAAVEIMFYLIATGVKIRTPLFTAKLKFSGEYDGTETRLNEGFPPEARFQASMQLSKYLEEHVNVEVLGKIENESFIADVLDEASALADETVTAGRLLTIRGNGLKIESEPGNKDMAGLFFIPEEGEPIKAMDIAVNEPRALKAIVPPFLEEGRYYRIEVRTQSLIKGNGRPMKNMRIIRSDSMFAARK